MTGKHRFPTPARDLVIVHSSDIHVDDPAGERMAGEDGAAALESVLNAARAAEADLVLLAGDTFEHNRLSHGLLDRAASLLAGAGRTVVMLPGNHDPAIPESAFHRGRLAGIGNVRVLGIDQDTLLFPELRLEIWGHAHRDYGDMEPLRQPRPRRSFWQIAMAHGHYEAAPDPRTALRPSWIISDEQIEATGADYVALGHWNRARRVGSGGVAAYYSGSPDLEGTVNVVRLTRDGRVAVARERLR